MRQVELIYDVGCPNVEAARAELLRAFAATGGTCRWQEWQVDDPDAPPHVGGCGSPTILVDGRDVTGSGEQGGAHCRLYPRPDGSVAGVPSADVIAQALRTGSGATAEETGGWKLGLATVPGIAAALLPKVACPACWPAYAGFASSVGLGFVLDAAYLFPFTAALLALATGALAFRASRRRGYGPFFVGFTGATIALVGKFIYASDPAMYAGLALLLSASIWNSWPRRRAASSCSSCTAGGPQAPTLNHPPRRS